MGRIRGGGKRRCSSLDSTARSPSIFPREQEGEEVLGPSSARQATVKLSDGSGSERPSMPPDQNGVPIFASSRPKSRPSVLPMAIASNQGGPRMVPSPRHKSPDAVPMPVSPNPGAPHIVPVSRAKSPEVAPTPVFPNQSGPHVVPLPRFRRPAVVPMLVAPNQGAPSVVPLSKPRSPPMPIGPNTSTTFSNVCSICGKVFKNHKAMWGHKGSHNRIRTAGSKRRSKLQPSPSPQPRPSALAIRSSGSDQPMPRVSLELGLALANGATRGSLGPSGVPPMRGPTRDWLRFKEWLARPVFDPTGIQRSPTCFVQPLSDEELELKLGI